MDVGLGRPQRARRETAQGDAGRRDEGRLEAAVAAQPAQLGRAQGGRGATGRRREPGRCVRPSRPPRSAIASSFHVPFSTVSREIERRIPTAAKLMMRDEPPALMNGSVIPVIGSSATTTPMLMNAWRHSQAVMPAASSAPNVSGARERDADARVGQDEEQRDDDDRADHPELLADLGEDEVVEGVRDEHLALARGRCRTTPPTPSASRPWTVWKPSPRRSSQGSCQTRMRSSW